MLNSTTNTPVVTLKLTDEGKEKFAEATKNNLKKKIYILKEFISEKLPKELSFLVEYISIKEIEIKIKN